MILIFILRVILIKDKVKVNKIEFSMSDNLFLESLSIRYLIFNHIFVIVLDTLVFFHAKSIITVRITQML